ncbi:hypothetical protein COW36_22325 [bacterium (Candidatus Blackallbacteria) CG17_big_fil_post_rev_8_21_14_2_50_48_46]|uniref:YkgJ family cysteine cluster protein n=1 Tax=bacterium (Candidatus Blackallbacteria) CG17_big_fil_post_rev_8_21_14_2_50_48_46 TaxID=2014261 RepID=A0A2M7FZ36_9BACT|nr:MAG: hypothetical protein COW64_13755 [bacterium (Candidatus Blackallbacteria) CG18_big_fil_WC_8_21_14_2_50_49_26]PIW14350.1 MAG: hypothetical protein COW36_22325 [bacterium (Candidatus Blackallbacteria) CG17_big_fil_post_rev_8_21_14_2_50_48_46]PIW45619.1 MAG: hypothetical protein COW20_19930 [bacterium (Candidatus Blackallbacteria) CG13_big_fil_rev_8_21_14_2_50_49_14]
MWFIQPRLNFACNQCGECCREMDVPLSHADLIQLRQAHPQAEPESFVRKHRSHPMHPEAVLLDQNYFILYLQRRESDDACVFLGEQGQCLNYPARPRACRSFPFDQQPNGRLRIMPDIDFLYQDYCDKTPVEKMALQEARKHLASGNDEFHRYHQIVERWNRRVERKQNQQTLTHFLSFLLTLSEISNQPLPPSA